MLKYGDSVSSAIDGTPISGAEVRVYTDDGLSLASVYADENGVNVLIQPILTDHLGYYSFYVADGRYDLTVHVGTEEVSRDNITMVDTRALKSRALLLPEGEAAPVLPAAVARAGKLLGFDSATGSPSMVDISDLGGSAVFLTTADGLAATVDGEYFWVIGDNIQTSLTLYRNDAGSATEIARAPAQALVATMADPWQRAEKKFGYDLYGDTNYTLGIPTTVRRKHGIATFGNSHGNAQGTTFENGPGEQLKAINAALIPEQDVYHDNYAVSGSWQTQLGEQISAMEAAHAAAMAPGGDGRSRIPDIALILDPANDGNTIIYHSLEGPLVYREVLAGNIRRLHNLGCVVMVITCPLVHPTRSLANGRFDMPEPFFTSYPKTGFVAGENYQGFTFDAVTQSITSTTVGQFLYDNNMLGPGQFLYDWRGRFLEISHDPANWVDTTRTTLYLVPGSIDVTEFNSHSMYQAKMNAETQLVPKRSQSITPHPIGPNGEMITASVRHLQLNRAAREVAAQHGAIIVDWAAAFQALLTSDAVYDTYYPNGDDYHMGAAGYQLLTPLFRKIMNRIINGEVA
jgi:hypothetical protein